MSVVSLGSARDEIQACLRTSADGARTVSHVTDGHCTVHVTRVLTAPLAIVATADCQAAPAKQAKVATVDLDWGGSIPLTHWLVFAVDAHVVHARRKDVAKALEKRDEKTRALLERALGESPAAAKARWAAQARQADVAKAYGCVLDATTRPAWDASVAAAVRDGYAVVDKGGVCFVRACRLTLRARVKVQ